MSIPLAHYDPSQHLLRLTATGVVPEMRHWRKNGWLIRKIGVLLHVGPYRLSSIVQALMAMKKVDEVTAGATLSKMRYYIEKHFETNPRKRDRLLAIINSAAAPT